MEFLTEYYNTIVVDKFKELRGAHKADLFIYCVLYIYGGVYLDIKTELISPISDIFNKHNIDVYTVLSMINNTVYQRIIATPPRNELFLHLISYMLSVPSITVKFNYQIFTTDFYNKIKSDTCIVQAGYNKGKIYNYYLFQEKCSSNSKDCTDGLDRYGYCCHIHDTYGKIIKTRYSNFPWR